MKQKSIIRYSILFSMLLLMFSSCMVTRTTIGEGPVGTAGETEVYSKAKQMYLFWGLVKLGSSQPVVPKHGDVQIKTSFNVVDSIITSVTGGIFSMQTIKVIVNETPPQQE